MLGFAPVAALSVSEINLGAAIDVSTGYFNLAGEDPPVDIEYIYSSSSNVRKRVFIQDNSVSYRKGKTGLAYNTAGISWGYMPFGGAALVTVTPVTATLGTWVSGGFVEVGGGWYEIGLPNALVGSSEAEMFIIGMSGAADVQVRYLMRGTIQ